MKITTILNRPDLLSQHTDVKTEDVEIDMFKFESQVFHMSDKVTFHDARDNSFKVLKDRYCLTDDQLKQLRDNANAAT